MRRRDFLVSIGLSPLILVPAPALAAGESPSVDQLWTKPRELWVTRPASGESGRFVYWADGQVIDDEYFRLCRLMRDLRENKAVAMHIGLLNFQYAIQQGVNHYFGAAPFVLTDAHRTERTNRLIENAAEKSQHLKAAANDGYYEKPSIPDLFKLASWFGVGGVGIYPRHVHIDAGRTRRWAGGYGPAKGHRR